VLQRPRGDEGVSGLYAVRRTEQCDVPAVTFHESTMTDPTNLPRLYGEKEIGKILKRTTELQHEEPSAPSAGSMSLQELEDIAAETGIDPTFLRRAAPEIDTGAIEVSTWGKLLGE